MEEGDQVSAKAPPRGLVDEVDARHPKLVKGRFDIGHLERYMVHPLAAALEEPPHGAFGIERLDELDPAPADA